jgi:putative SOS response-associated peptidase YedK
MCGRYKLTTSMSELSRAFDAVLDPALSAQPPRYNTAPTDLMPVVRVIDGRRQLQALRWGLVPFWARDLKIGSTMINARSETLFEKPAFRDALQKRRCLVVLDGFYEWKGVGRQKIPQLITLDGGAPFSIAGLWARWKGELGEVQSFTIVTTAANQALREVHDRMPVLIDERDRDEWLDPTNDVVDLERLASPRPWPGLQIRAVSRRVGNVKNDDAGVLDADVDTGLDVGADDVDASPTPKKAPRKKAAPKKATPTKATPADGADALQADLFSRPRRR